jgi:hypothetical protein
VVNLKLALVSTNRETLDGVQDYFKRVGAKLSTVPRLEDTREKANGVDVVVLFADDYPREAVLRVVGELSVKLIIVVTAEVNAYEPRPAGDGVPRVLVLARPAWGWMLLDAARLAVSRDERRA